MSTQIQFKAGQFQSFTSTRSFALGNSGTTIQEGTELLFDGTYVKYEGGHPLSMPQLRGAIKTGWLVMSENYDPDDRSASIPKPAGVQFRSAQGGNPMDPNPRTPVTTADAEEQEVGTVGDHAKATKDHNANNRGANVRPGQRASVMTQVEPQEGVPVRTLSTPTTQRTNLEHADEAIRKANSTKVQPGQGRTREEVMAAMSSAEREEYQAQLEAHKAAKHVDDVPKVVNRVAPVKNQQKEGFNINNEVGGGIETFDAAGATAPVEETVTEMEGMKFSNTNVGRRAQQKPAPKASVPATNGDHRRKIAKAICPDFPDNYVFDDTARKKIARLQADYEDRPDVIRAVAAAESDDDMKRRLVDEFPEAFA